jgi:hypothetical protein
MGKYEDCVWRVGNKLGRTIYAIVDPESRDGACDVFLGMMETRELAAYIVKTHNSILRIFMEK